LKETIYHKIPNYFGFRIYFLSTILYFFLVFPVAGILLFKYVPDFMKRNELTQKQSTQSPLIPKTLQSTSDSLTGYLFQSYPLASPRSGKLSALMPQPIDIRTPGDQATGFNLSENSSQIGGTMALLVRLLFISFLLGLGFNLPFKIYFSRKKKNRPVPEKLHRFCVRYLLKSPLINVGILFLAYGITIGYMVYIIAFSKEVDDINHQFYLQFFFITIVATILTLMFVYWWQKHRVHLRYLEHVFSEQELRRRIFNIKAGRIQNRLWISSAMTTLLPLLIVIFYLYLSISGVKELGFPDFSDDQKAILLGKYRALNLGMESGSMNGFYYVNVVNTLLMIIGIGTGISIALIYIVLFVRWTTEDIVYPVHELLKNMQRAGRGELDSFSVVRTNDEIGDLSAGFNEMSERLQNYFMSLTEINKANSRFVPKQFLEYLGKESIADINLGDQVQKEMTVLFTDIRDFTSISEKMSPKENFDFLNSYLGYMEPVIRHNNGFIDKFMGDSIMALFPEKPEDAINASIEMRIKLVEFNQIMGQFDKPNINSGIGLHTGLLMLGIVGGEGRMDGTVISDAVNLTSRVEGLTKIYGSSIIITEDTLIKLNDPSHYHYRFLDIVKVKGKKEAVYIFEVFDGDPERIKRLKLSRKDEYGKALQSYKKKEFRLALQIFEELHHFDPDDKVYHLYADRCKRFIKTGVPDHWDGVESMDVKL
jgi:class 3 adenylate cyclase